MKYAALTLFLAVPILATIPIGATAFAAEEDAETSAEPQRLDAEYCFSGRGLKEELAKFDGLKASRRDTVGAVINLVFAVDEGELPPERVELRDGEAIDILSLSLAGNQHFTRNLTPDIEAASDAGQLCVVDPAREGRLQNDLGYRLQSAFNIRYLETPGTHDLASIKDGLKDGRSHWKKMVGAMGFMVPKFDHIAVAGADENNPPVVTALKDGVAFGTPEGELYDGARMVDIDVLDDLGADAIRIEADYYRLTPSPDAKTVKRFSGG